MDFILACGLCVAGLGKAVFPPVIWWAVIGSIWFVSISIVRSRFNLPSRLIPGPLVAILMLFLISVLGYAVAGPTLHLLLLPLCLFTTNLKQRVGRESELPGVGIEIGRIAAGSDDSLSDFREILSSTGSPLVAKEIGSHVECPLQDLECAALLVAVLDGIEGSYNTGDLEDRLMRVSGLELPEGTSARPGAPSWPGSQRYWRRKEEQLLLYPTRTWVPGR